MIYALCWLFFNLGIFIGFWLCAVLSSGSDADDLTEQMLDVEQFK